MDSFNVVSEYKNYKLIPNINPMYFIFAYLLFLSLYCCLKRRTSILDKDIENI